MKNKNNNFIDAHRISIYILFGAGIAIMIWGLFFYQYELPTSDSTKTTSLSTITRDLKQAFSIFSSQKQAHAPTSDEEEVEALREKVFGHLQN